MKKRTGLLYNPLFVYSLLFRYSLLFGKLEFGKGWKDVMRELASLPAAERREEYEWTLRRVKMKQDPDHLGCQTVGFLINAALFDLVE
jgi:hypothetical protein